MKKEYTVESFKRKLRDKEEIVEKRKQMLSDRFPEIALLIKSIDECAIDAIMSGADAQAFEKKMHELNVKLMNELVKIGFPSDYLEIKYDCSICKDRGFINGRKCACLEKYLSKNIGDDSLSLRAGSFKEFDPSLFSTRKNKKGVSPRENILKNRKTALEFVENFDEDTEMLGLIFSGEAGTGKSFLAASIGKTLSKNHSVICLSAREFEDRIKDFSNPNLNEEKNRMYECNLLILDDLGIETQSDYMNNEILKLLNDRKLYGKKMIITTNLSLVDIRDKYMSRIYSRLVSDFVFLRFFGDDVRIAKRLRNSIKSNTKG